MTVQRGPVPNRSAPDVKEVQPATPGSCAGPGSWQNIRNGHRGAALVGTPLLVLGVALAAVNLRPAVTSLASVLEEMRVSLDASHAWASALTAVPTICFGAAGVLAPLVGRKWGLARAIGIALVLLTAGLLARVLDGPVVVLGGTLLACSGIALGNVLLPVVIKQSFPNRIGLVTGVYTAALAAGGGLGSAVTPTVHDWLGGWRAGLAAWAALSLAALLIWSAAARHDRGADVLTQVRGRPLWRNGLAWTVTVYFALQALVAYTVMGWMPEVLIDGGVDRTTAGLLLSVTNLLGVPLSLLLPPLAARRRTQTGYLVAMTGIGATGMLGLLLAPGAVPLLWAVLLGFGMGVFPLTITLIALRSSTPSDTASLSAMTQSVGYLLAAVGPFLFGVLRGATGGWTVSLLFILAVLVCQMLLGIAAGRDRVV